MALAVMTIVAALHPIHAPAQTKPTFEVVSIKPLSDGYMETRMKRSGGRITWTTDLSYLISYAYRLQRDRLLGVPSSEHTYKVDAVTDPAATDDQVRLMFQAMLADRMKMTLHRVTKESDVLLLSVGKKGPKIKEARPEDPPPPLPEWSKDASAAGFEGRIATTYLKNQIGVLAMTGRRVSMAQLADELQLLMKQPVLDRTELPGKYYFAFRYAGDQAVDSDAPSLPAALQENLGLKLEKGKGPVENLIVDHIETLPTEN